ncbi:uncharacterized protein LOC126552725 isoform X21 [Aphis gossypii]|uniref:uncharacterized protein LOC126552725 isoform X21 n=1 Tax=Aphis gossypii TaxID=80765 RepID=UPI002158C5C9|nr:uncharacterized protein LOC126552725 isoform X21 [Aphis gossypii]
MSESEKLMCVCGKKRENLNITNWKRHLDNCKQRKTKINSRSITSFFNTPKPKKICMDTDIIRYPYPTPNGSSVHEQIKKKDMILTPSSVNKNVLDSVVGNTFSQIVKEIDQDSGNPFNKNVLDSVVGNTFSQIVKEIDQDSGNPFNKNVLDSVVGNTFSQIVKEIDQDSGNPFNKNVLDSVVGNTFSQIVKEIDQDSGNPFNKNVLDSVVGNTFSQIVKEIDQDSGNPFNKNDMNFINTNMETVDIEVDTEMETVDMFRNDPAHFVKLKHINRKLEV